MYQRYRNFMGQDTVFIIPLVLLALAKELRYFFVLLTSGHGLPQSTDSQWYLDYANALVANFCDGVDMNDVLYLGYNLLLSLLLYIFKDPVIIVFIQAVTAALGVILVYKIANMLFNRTTAIIAALFYCAAWDITLWSMYILSDSFFTSLLLLCVYFLLMALESHQRKYQMLFVGALLYLMIFRPAGILMGVMLLLYLVVRLDGKILRGYLQRYRLPLGVFLTVGGLILASLYAGNHLDPFASSVQLNAKKVLYNIYAKGWVYDKPTGHDYFFRSDYNINICNSLVLSYLINNWDHVLFVYAKRMVAFLGNWIWQANVHTFSGMIALAGNLLPTILFLLGSIAAVVNGLFRRASVVWLIVLGVVAFCVMIFIDAMYRYRLPAIPFIAIIAAYGAERTLQIMMNWLPIKKIRGC